MRNKKDSQEENPLIYYTIILLAISILFYKWFNELDKNVLIQDLIYVGSGMFAVLLFFAIIIFIIRGYILKEEKSKIISKLLIHLANILIVSTLIYRIIIHSNNLLIHGIITIIIILYYNYKIQLLISEGIIQHKAYNIQIEVEKDEIKKFLNQDLKKLSFEQLESQEIYFRLKKYYDESKRPFIDPFIKKIDEVSFLRYKNAKESELLELRHKKIGAQRELEQIQQEKNELLMDENSKKAQKEYSLTHREENVILSNRLTKEDKAILKKAKHKQVNEYCAHQKKILIVFVKPIMGHSATHTFLVWSIKRLLEDFDVTRIETHDTKDADITFIHYNKKYAIEIETGTLLKKERQLKNKTHMLNNKYPHRWFFVVSNRNLQSQYKKYCTTTQRNRVSETLTKMLENTHPKKAGEKR